MHQRPATGEDRFDLSNPHDAREPREGAARRLDLSVPQVAGSVVAAVAAAVLASRLGVYGTIVGAGVVSAVATCGGPLVQHLFSRTGDQLRDARTPERRRRPSAESVRPPAPSAGEFGAATTHGTRMRGWKRPAAAAAVVFGVAMAGITGYELLAGSGLDGSPGTTVGSVVRGGSGGGGDTSPQPDAPSRQPENETNRTDGTGGTGGTGGTQDRTERDDAPRDDPANPAGPASGGGENSGSGESAPPGGKPSSGPSGSPDPSASEPDPSAPASPGAATGSGNKGTGPESGSRTGTDPGSGTAGSAPGGG
ncbi:hypothetical protein [Streptomyces qinzhouensis]|uniref:hypothetical protein n=1 Tax=Streptomyces qinzhouensis TaxID=2599401 RepID=UPI001646F208|nr:hypothetical protein [Streptomyces qinzhouensis]